MVSRCCCPLCWSPNIFCYFSRPDWLKLMPVKIFLNHKINISKSLICLFLLVLDLTKGFHAIRIETSNQKLFFALLCRVVFHHKAAVFTAFDSVDYWKGWLTTDLFRWWGRFINIRIEQTSWVRSSESDHHPLYSPSFHQHRKTIFLGCIRCQGNSLCKLHQKNKEKERVASRSKTIVLLPSVPHKSNTTTFVSAPRCSCSGCSPP